MKLTRRNALIGLGSLVAGSGALVGTGAFSSVEADRTVSIGVTGDSSALLGLTVNDTGFSGVTGDGGGNAIDIQTDILNDEATTRFNGVLTVTNNGSNGVNLDITSIDNGITFYDSNGDDLSSNSESLSLGTTSSEDLDLEVDTTTAANGDSLNVTFRAQ